MNGRRNLYSGVIVALALLLFAVQPVFQRLRGGQPVDDPLAGVWGGHVTFHVPNDPTFWHHKPGPHRDAVLYFELKKYDSTIGWYGGAGQIFISGESGPRTIHISKFLLDKDGSIDFRLDLQDGFYDEITGNLQNGTMTWGSATSPGLKAELHHGTTSDFQKLLSSSEAAQLRQDELSK